MSLSDKSFTFARLKGQENYEIWALRMRSYLTEKGYVEALEQDNLEASTIAKALAAIRLGVEDGPLLQISNKAIAKDA